MVWPKLTFSGQDGLGMESGNYLEFCIAYSHGKMARRPLSQKFRAKL